VKGGGGGAHGETHKPSSDSTNLAVIYGLGGAPVNHPLVRPNVGEGAHVIVHKPARISGQPCVRVAGSGSAGLRDQGGGVLLLARDGCCAGLAKRAVRLAG